MKRILIVVDYQNDFVDGSLGFENALKLEDKISKRIKKAVEDGEEVIFTKDVHQNDYMSTEEGKNLPVPHCIKGTSGCEFYGKINELAKGHLIFEKETFGSTKLGEYLKNNQFDQITLVGLVSYICVLSNAVIAKAYCPNAHIIVEKQLTDGPDKILQDKAFEVMSNIHVEIK